MALPVPEFLREGQAYWRLGQRDHVTRDQRKIVLVGWQTFCADCAEPFVCEATEGSSPEVRRCADHRMPGRRVAGTRRT